MDKTTSKLDIFIKILKEEFDVGKLADSLTVLTIAFVIISGLAAINYYLEDADITIQYTETRSIFSDKRYNLNKSKYDSDLNLSQLGDLSKLYKWVSDLNGKSGSFKKTEEYMSKKIDFGFANSLVESQVISLFDTTTQCMVTNVGKADASNVILKIYSLNDSKIAKIYETNKTGDYYSRIKNYDSDDCEYLIGNLGANESRTIEIETDGNPISNDQIIILYNDKPKNNKDKFLSQAYHYSKIISGFLIFFFIVRLIVLVKYYSKNLDSN